MFAFLIMYIYIDLIGEGEMIQGWGRMCYLP